MFLLQDPARPARGRPEAPSPGHDHDRGGAVRQARRDRARRRGAGPPEEGGRGRGQEGGPRGQRRRQGDRRRKAPSSAGEGKAGAQARGQTEGGPGRGEEEGGEKARPRQEISPEEKEVRETRMAGFNREELRTYARDKRKEYENVLEKIVEIPSVSVDPDAQGRRAPGGRVRRRSPRVFRSEGEALRDERASARLRPLRQGPSVPDGHRLQPPRRPARRGPRLEDRALRLHPRRRQVSSGAARPTTRGRPSRRSSARATRSSRASRSTSTSSGSSRRRSAAPHFETTIRANAKDVRHRLGRRLGHRLGVALAARLPGGAAGPAGLPLRPADRRDRPALGHGRRRGPQPGRPSSASLIAECVDGKTGRVKIPGFYEDVVAAHEEGAGGPEELRIHRQGLQARPPLPVAPRERRARSDEAHLDDADLRGPRDRRRLPGPGREDDHPAQGHGHRVLPARARHGSEEGREAGQGLREVEERRREGLRRARAAGLLGQDHAARTPTRSAAR